MESITQNIENFELGDDDPETNIQKVRDLRKSIEDKQEYAIEKEILDWFLNWWHTNDTKELLDMAKLLQNESITNENLTNLLDFGIVRLSNNIRPSEINYYVDLLYEISKNKIDIYYKSWIKLGTLISSCLKLVSSK